MELIKSAQRLQRRIYSLVIVLERDRISLLKGCGQSLEQKMVSIGSSIMMMMIIILSQAETAKSSGTGKLTYSRW